MLLEKFCKIYQNRYTQKIFAIEFGILYHTIVILVVMRTKSNLKTPVFTRGFYNGRLTFNKFLCTILMHIYTHNIFVTSKNFNTYIYAKNIEGGFYKWSIVTMVQDDVKYVILQLTELHTSIIKMLIC